MSAAKTNAERQREYIERWRAAGYKLLRNFWVHPEDEAPVRLYAEKLQRKRSKGVK